MVGVISGLIGTYGFRLTPHVEIRSIIVAYCLGMLVTFLTVSISAARVSRLNIVSAIRDIPDVPKPDMKLADQVLEPFNQLGMGQPLGCIGGLFSLIASLFKSGPVTGTLGLVLLVLGWVAPNGFAFHTGATLTIIAVGLTIRWLLARGNMRHSTRDRIAFTIAGALLVLYWAKPDNNVQCRPPPGCAQLRVGPGRSPAARAQNGCGIPDGCHLPHRYGHRHVQPHHVCADSNLGTHPDQPAG
jgi:putative ABC transport system permease protein